MSTEYRRGIPSTAHVEAATRLGLLWEDAYPDGQQGRWRLEIRSGVLFSDFSEADGGFTNWDQDLSQDRYSLEGYSLRPIRPDGTPVDWEVLDRQPSAQPQGFRADLWARLNEWITANWLNTLGDIEAVNDRGISGRSRRYSWDELGLDTETDEADRQALIARWTIYQELKPLYDLVDGAQGEAAMPRDVEAEWFTAATMPVPASGHWFLCCDVRGIHTRNHRYVTWRPEEAGYGVPLRNFAAVLDAVAERRVAERMRGQTQATTVTTAQPEPRRFADVRPDRHGWRWWLVRHALPLHQTWLRIDHNRPYDWSTVETVIPTDEQGNPVSWEAAGFAAEAVRGAQESMQRAAHDATPGRSVGDIEWTATGLPVTRDMTVEPATGMVRSTHTARIRRLDQFVAEAIRAGNTGDFSIESRIRPQGQAVSAVSEQGLPEVAPAGMVQSVNSDGTVTVRLNGDGSVSPAREGEAGAIRARWAAPEGFYIGTSFFSTEPPTPPRPGQFSNNPTTPPLTPEGFQQALETVQMAPGLYQETLDWVTRQISQVIIGVDTAKAPPITTLPLPLPRFTADELDDVDHSKTTKLDEVTLRRGKMPTVEQIAKYREVRAKRSGGTVADALKESRIDCEVAQYVLERWAGGLGDELALWLLRAVGKYSRSDLRFTQRSVDELAQRELTHEAGSIETAEHSPTAQREREEAEARRQRLAELRQRLTAERAAQPQEMAKESDTVSRFDLIEPDPQADPAASIRAWEARQAAAKVRPAAVPPRIAKPAATPRRPAIEVVDAEVDGLSRSEAFTALFGRALNGGC